MTDSKSLKLLVVEDDLEDEQLLCEALIEIEENRQWCNWRSANIVQVDHLADALDCLERDRFDVVLLNLSLPDSPVLLDTFLEAQACAGDSPIIVLADEDDENLANKLVREGAQDVLLKSELECALLARAMRYAIERQRRNRALGWSPFQDGLTRTLSRQGFTMIAGHYAELALDTSLSALLSFLEIYNLPDRTPEEREARELILIRAGEVLRSAFSAPALIGRLARCRFGVVTAGLARPTVEALLNRAAAAIENIAPNSRPSITVRYSVAELGPDDNLEELIRDGPAQVSAPERWLVKTVILAD